MVWLYFPSLHLNMHVLSTNCSSNWIILVLNIGYCNLPPLPSPPSSVPSLLVSLFFHPPVIPVTLSVLVLMPVLNSVVALVPEVMLAPVDSKFTHLCVVVYVCYLINVLLCITSHQSFYWVYGIQKCHCHSLVRNRKIIYTLL